jgi:CRP/FNR family transcriptional regulator, nitrogen fixation regulation protein
MAMDGLRPEREGLFERNGFRRHFEARTGVLARRGLGVSMKFGADAEICGDGEPVDYVYEVVHGAVRTVKILPDGRRQIGGFYFAGDIFGLEDGDLHCLSAEAVADSTIRVIKRRALVGLAGDDRDLAQQLLVMATREIARVHSHALMLIQNAQERLSSFLVQLGERIAIRDLIVLPMSRQDIADHLGVTVETVSRTFTVLESASAIDLPNARTVVLRDRAALRSEPPHLGTPAEARGEIATTAYVR